MLTNVSGIRPGGRIQWLMFNRRHLPVVEEVCEIVKNVLDVTNVQFFQLVCDVV